jgi:hypothetical protein
VAAFTSYVHYAWRLQAVKSLLASFAFASALTGDCLPLLRKLAHKRDKTITWFEETQVARTHDPPAAPPDDGINLYYGVETSRGLRSCLKAGIGK